MKDLLDKYHPDLLYFDDTKLPLGSAGLSIAAHFFNANPQWNAGRQQAVIMSKGLSLDEQKAVVNDLERNMSMDLLTVPWQKELCIGPWHYDVNRYRSGYQTSRRMINLLVDVVSKNGTFLLAIPLPGSGEIDDKAVAFLDGMASWMSVNSECIYGTRPWTVYGEGPSVRNDGRARDRSTNAPRGIGPDHSAADIRFTTKGDTLYAIALGTPGDGRIAIRSLAANSPLYRGEIGSIQQLGVGGRLPFTRNASGVTVTIARPPAGNLAVALKVSRKQ